MLRANLHEQEIRQVVGLPGAGDRVLDGVAPLGAAEDRCLYFIKKKATTAIRESLAARRGCIVIALRGTGKLGDCLVLESTDPRAAIANVLGFIHDERRQRPWVADRKIAPGAVISPLAVVEGSVEIGEGAVVEPFCTVGPDVVIGRGTILRAGARIYPRVSIGEHTTIGPNSVIGYAGYGFVRDKAGNKTRIPHLGGVIIGSNIDIGALTSIQSGTIVPTVIEDYVKIDDNVEVGHNVRIERGASIVGGVVLGGSSIVGADAWVGMNATIRNSRKVGARSLVGMNASVQQDLEKNAVARAPRADVGTRTDGDSDAIGFTEP
jgi:UDP-3-O-[3-hydroxymyristoyl] glucosamine N-acyltransferase LpxD